MAFPKAGARTPASIGKIQVTLRDIPAVGVTPAAQGSGIDFEVLDVNEQVIDRPGSPDLFSYLTAAQVTTLKNFLTTIRTKLAVEVIG